MFHSSSLFLCSFKCKRDSRIKNIKTIKHKTKSPLKLINKGKTEAFCKRKSHENSGKDKIVPPIWWKDTTDMVGNLFL